MSSESRTVRTGPGLLTLLAVLFIGLKLTGYINWSWWLVLLPLYGGLALLVAIALVVGGGIAVVGLVDAIINKRRAR